MTPANSNASTPEEQLYSSFLFDQVSQEPINPLLSHQSHLHLIPLSSNTPSAFMSHSPMVNMSSAAAGQSWTPVLTDSTNTPVVQSIAATAAAMATANGNAHGAVSGISPNLLISEMNRTSHYATHFPPLTTVSASTGPLGVSDYTPAAAVGSDSCLFMPTAGQPQYHGGSASGGPDVAMATAPTYPSANIAGLGVFGNGISVPASHRCSAAIDMASSGLVSYPQLSGVHPAIVNVYPYPFSSGMDDHRRPGDSLDMEMSVAAASGVNTKLAECHLPASIGTPKTANTQNQPTREDALGRLLQCVSHRNENNGNQAADASTASTYSSSPSVALLNEEEEEEEEEEDLQSPPSITAISDDFSRPKRQTMSKRQQIIFCRYLLEHPGRPFPKEPDRLKLTIDSGVTKKRFYWWFSNQRHRSFDCSMVNGKKQYAPRIQFYRMCVRLGVLAPEHVPPKFRSQLKKRQK